MTTKRGGTTSGITNDDELLLKNKKQNYSDDDTQDSSTVDEDDQENDEQESTMDRGSSVIKMSSRTAVAATAAGSKPKRTSRNNNLSVEAKRRTSRRGSAGSSAATTAAALAAAAATSTSTDTSAKAVRTKTAIKKKKKSSTGHRLAVADCSFAQVAKSLYNYDLRKCDQEFLEHLFTALPQLKDVWDRIGFNVNTQQERLVKFFHRMTDLIDEIVDSEEDLEAQILDNIEQQRTSLKDLCFDLQLRYEDLKSTRSGSTMTILDLDQCLRGEIERLNVEKRKRCDEFKQLSAVEVELCARLVLKKTEQRLNIPSETEINNLRQRCKDLEKLLAKRRAEMEKIKEECVALTNDLEISRSDTFAELVLLESVDEMQLGEADIQKAIDFRDELVRKNREVLNEIASLRARIKELWSKLKIQNADLLPMVNSSGSGGEEGGGQTSFSKRTLLSELTHEYERCVQIKMENMQKFIEGVRVDIREICARMYYSDKQMKKLNQELLGSTDFNESLLEKHETLLEDLRFKYDENTSLFEKIGKWLKLWNEFMQFEEKTKDPQRFKQRGYNMLEEEKQRKTFNNQLPKLEEELHQLTNEYRELNGGAEFTVFGMSFADFVHTKRVDYEENKELERKEKQIMRDTIKKNETRYGSKPVTPLALRNKRKLAGIADGTHLNTPGAAHRSKLQRTEVHTPSSRVVNVARGLHNNNTPGNGTQIGGGVKVVASRAIGNPKRKSRTPGKSKARRSRILANQSKNAAAVAAAAAMSEANDTLQSGGQQLSTISGGADSTLKTATIATSSTTSLFQSSTLSSTSNLTTQSSASFKMARQAHLQQKQSCPPLSASSKFASTNCLLSTQIQRMTSTASNTFIEEENAELVETTMSMRSKDAAYVTQAAAARINEMIKTGGESGSKLMSYEINYAEFSRDLPRPIKFGQDATNFGQTKTSQLPTRSQLPRTTKK